MAHDDEAEDHSGALGGRCDGDVPVGRCRGPGGHRGLWTGSPRQGPGQRLQSLPSPRPRAGHQGTSLSRDSQSSFFNAGTGPGGGAAGAGVCLRGEGGGDAGSPGVAAERLQGDVKAVGVRLLAVGNAVGVWECLWGQGQRLGGGGRGKAVPPSLQRMPWRGVGGRPAVRGKRTYGGQPGQRVEEQGTGASRTQKHSEAGYGRPVDRGAWTNDPGNNQHSPNTPTTGLRERGNDTSRSTGRSGRQNTAPRRNMRREERVTVQGPVKEQQPDGMSHRGGAGGASLPSKDALGGGGGNPSPLPPPPSRQISLRLPLARMSGCLRALVSACTALRAPVHHFIPPSDARAWGCARGGGGNGEAVHREHNREKNPSPCNGPAVLVVRL